MAVYLAGIDIGTSGAKGMVFDLQGSWQLPATLEPLFAALDASVTLTPVMNAEDLERGFKEAGM